MFRIQIPCIWIHNTAANQAVVETFLPGLLLFYHYVIGVNLNEKLGLMQRPRYLRLAVQNVWLSTVFVVGLYALSEARKYFEQAAIRAVVRTPAEARAAVEYYERLDQLPEFDLEQWTRSKEGRRARLGYAFVRCGVLVLYVVHQKTTVSRLCTC